jgi:hypothetical protein
MLLHSEVVLQRYDIIKREISARAPNGSVMTEAMREVSHELIWPFRIVVGPQEKGEKPRFLLVLNHGGQGNDEIIWEMHGYHRERDILILGTRFRNIFYFGHAQALETGQMNEGLMYVMRNVEAAMQASAENRDE